MRVPVINPEKERMLFAYIVGVTKNLRGSVIRINAALDHMHILVKLPTTVSAADYAATVKRSSSIFISTNKLFPSFMGWSREYSVETVSPELVSRIRDYIAGQKQHHQIISFEEEWLSKLSDEERKSWDMRYFDR